MELRESDKIKIEVAGRSIYIDPEKIPTGKFVEMMMLHGANQHVASTQAMMEMLLASVGRQQLDEFPLVWYPFILQTWLDAVVQNVMGPIEVGDEIDEIVKRIDNDSN